MGRLLVLVLLAMAATAGLAGCRSGNFARDELIPQDFLVLDAALTDLAAWDDSMMLITTENRHGRTEVVFHEKTAGAANGMLSDQQIRCELDRTSRVLPDDLSTNLRQRNTRSLSLGDYRPTGQSIVVKDIEDDVLSDDSDFEARYPFARCYVATWLPGYSDDGRTAVLRFLLGPGSACGTYLLVLEQGQWTVKWRDLARYPD